jgi:uncharacterized BrkB/YihY/UPF0761 family membrane protein
MLGFRTPAALVLNHPGAFAIRVLRSFSANQSYLIAGGVAYNTLLSLLPPLILILIAMAIFVEQSAVLTTVGVAPTWSAASPTKWRSIAWWAPC